MTLKVDVVENTSGGPVTLTDQVAAKMWSASNGDTTIYASFNLSSITDNGSGDNTYTLTSSMSSAYYSIYAMGRSDDNATGRMAAPCLTSQRAVPTSSVYNIAFHYSNTDLRECDHETTGVIGDLA